MDDAAATGFFDLVIGPLLPFGGALERPFGLSINGKSPSVVLPSASLSVALSDRLPLSSSDSVDLRFTGGTMDISCRLTLGCHVITSKVRAVLLCVGVLVRIIVLAIRG